MSEDRSYIGQYLDLEFDNVNLENKISIQNAVTLFKNDSTQSLRSEFSSDLANRYDQISLKRTEILSISFYMYATLLFKTIQKTSSSLQDEEMKAFINLVYFYYLPSTADFRFLKCLYKYFESLDADTGIVNFKSLFVTKTQMDDIWFAKNYFIHHMVYSNYQITKSLCSQTQIAESNPTTCLSLD